MTDLLTAFDIEAQATAAGLSMAEVCRRAGVAQSTFTRWKTGKTEPTLDVYRKLRDAASPPMATPPAGFEKGRYPMADEVPVGRSYSLSERPMEYSYPPGVQARMQVSLGETGDEREAADIFVRIDRECAVEDARADRLLRLYRP